MHLVNDQRLHQLRLCDGRNHLENGLLAKYGSTLSDSIYITRKPERSQPVEERILEASWAPQIGDMSRLKAKSSKAVDGIINAAGEEIVAEGWQGAHEETEHCRLLHVLLPVSLEHGQLVEIRQERQIVGAHQVGRRCRRDQ